MEVVNGYKISGNLAEIGRRYEVTDAGGAIVHVAIRKPDAVAHAKGLPAGDVEMPVFKAPEPAKVVPAPKKEVSDKDKLLAKDPPSKKKKGK